METSRRLYAWAVPAAAPGARWDHTWVTSYDNRVNPFPDITAIEHARHDYWFCWGHFHLRGGTPNLADGSLGSREKNAEAALYLAGSNVDCWVNFAARGTIFNYGVDGVCHQLANQILYATALDGAPPLTVSSAVGYWVSCAIYGSYGLQHSAWKNRIAISKAVEAPPSDAPETKTSDGADPDPHGEFENHVGKALGADKLSVASQLLGLRARFQGEAATRAHAAVALSAHELNARNQRFLDDAGELLGDDAFTAVFGVKPGAKVNLVLADPSKRTAGSVASKSACLNCGFLRDSLAPERRGPTLLAAVDMEIEGHDAIDSARAL